MVAPSQSSSGASQTPPSDNNPTASNDGQGSPRLNQTQLMLTITNPKLDAHRRQKELEAAQLDKINRATEHARLAATDDAFDSLSDISHVGYEHADQFDLLLDFDDLHTEDMDVDEDPEVLIQKFLALVDDKEAEIKLAKNQSGQIQVNPEEKKYYSNPSAYQSLSKSN